MSVCGIQANQANAYRGLQPAQQSCQSPQQAGKTGGGCAAKQSACGQSSVGQKSNVQGADPAKQLM